GHGRVAVRDAGLPGERRRRVRRVQRQDGPVQGQRPVVLEHGARDRPDGDLAARVRPPGGRNPVAASRRGPRLAGADRRSNLAAADRVCDVVRRWLAVTGTVLLIAAWWALPVAAASASSSGGMPEGLQVWLDSDSLTPDAPPGGVLQVGYTFWDTRVGDFPNVEGPYVKLHPAKGKAAPSEAIIEQDFPGHVLATVTVPEGGVGA